MSVFSKNQGFPSPIGKLFPIEGNTFFPIIWLNVQAGRWRLPAVFPSSISGPDRFLDCQQ